MTRIDQKPPSQTISGGTIKINVVPNGRKPPSKPPREPKQ